MTSAATSEPLIVCSELCFAYGDRQVLRAVACEVVEGSATAVIGPNGAGKTTLLRLLLGLAAPDAGSLTFRGRAYETFSRRALARRMAYVPQTRSADVTLSVEQMLLLSRYPYFAGWKAGFAGWKAGANQADFVAIEQALERVALSAARHVRLDELSGGERQLVYVAAALAQSSDVLILDEPTSELDPRHELEIERVLKELVHEGRTVLFATHDLSFAARAGDRVLALDRGEVAFAGARENVLVPERLGELYGARFMMVEQGGVSVPVLEARL